jgi:hypothetical protein
MFRDGVGMKGQKRVERVCRAWFDREFVRVDEFGCWATIVAGKPGTMSRDGEVRAGRSEQQPQQPQQPQQQSSAFFALTRIHVQDHAMLCSDVKKPPQFDEMVKIAERIGDVLGTFYRVDMFIAEDGGVVLGELTPYPFASNMHCFAKDTGNPRDPADECYMGRLWQEMETKYGKWDNVPVPHQLLDGFGQIPSNSTERCARVREAKSMFD